MICWCGSEDKSKLCICWMSGSIVFWQCAHFLPLPGLLGIIHIESWCIHSVTTCWIAQDRNDTFFIVTVGYHICLWISPLRLLLLQILVSSEVCLKYVFFCVRLLQLKCLLCIKCLCIKCMVSISIMWSFVLAVFVFSKICWNPPFVTQH